MSFERICLKYLYSVLCMYCQIDVFRKFLYIFNRSHQWLPWWRHQIEAFSALLAICAGIHRWPGNSPRQGQWREALMLSLICASINDSVNNRKAGGLRRHRAHYDVTVMQTTTSWSAVRVVIAWPRVVTILHVVTPTSPPGGHCVKYGQPGTHRPWHLSRR